MFQDWHAEHTFALVALLIIAMFSICYTVPGLLGALSYITTTFFLFTGIGVLALGCLHLYNMHKNS